MLFYFKTTQGTNRRPPLLAQPPLPGCRDQFVHTYFIAYASVSLTRKREQLFYTTTPYPKTRGSGFKKFRAILCGISNTSLNMYLATKQPQYIVS